MNIHFENVNINSNSGPNSFGRKLLKYMGNVGHTFNPTEKNDVVLAFIQASKNSYDVPLIQRLDGIYFNLSQPYKIQNTNIEKTYHHSHGVIYQSNFNKTLTTKYFGDHKNSVVIHNGADIDFIETVPALSHPKIDKFDNVWSCAASWRPHKRLSENIRYFLF